MGSTFVDSIRETQRSLLAKHPELIIMGQGVCDPTGVFGSVKDLHKEFPKQCYETPLSEECMTGVALGLAINGHKVIHVHQRADFLMCCMNQIVNHIAKWNYMFNRTKPLPIVIRAVIGRGWGQGPQHSQNPAAMLGRIPGLDVYVPRNAIAFHQAIHRAMNDGFPSIILEDKRLYNQPHDISYEYIPKEKAKVLLFGEIGIAPEMAEAAKMLEADGIPTIATDAVLATHFPEAILVCDPDWPDIGLASQYMSRIAEGGYRGKLARLTWPNHPVPTAADQEAAFYPDAARIVAKVKEMLA